MLRCLGLNIICQVMLINVPAVITQQGSELGGGEDKHFPIHYLLLISGGIKKKKKELHCTHFKGW